MGLHDKLRDGGKDLAPAWGIIRGNNLLDALRDASVDPNNKITPEQLLSAQLEMKKLAESSPESLCRCTQDISEAIMCRTAQQHGSDLRFNHKVRSFEHFENRVEALVNDLNSELTYTISADYLIAADGTSSLIRSALGVPVSGNIKGKDLLNIYFQAELGSFVKGQEFSRFLIERPDLTGFLLTINNKERWAFHLRYHPELGERASDYSAERVIGILHRM